MRHFDHTFLHRQIVISGEETFLAMTLVHLCFWPLVFQFLGPEDLVRVSAVCLTWRRYVFRGCKSTTKRLFECEGIDLADTGNLFQKVPQILCTEKDDQLEGDINISKGFSKACCRSKRTSHVEPRRLRGSYRTINLSSETVPSFFEEHKHFSQQPVARSFCCLPVLLSLITRNLRKRT